VGVRLVIPSQVLVELRVAPLTDLRSIRKDITVIVGEIESMAAGKLVDIAVARCRWRAVTAAIKMRHELHEVAGWPGQPVGERVITGHERCALAVAILSRRCTTQVACLARRDLAACETASVIETVGLLGAFLSDARVEPRRNVVEVNGWCSRGQDESCLD
jgi:hypothetical protein